MTLVLDVVGRRLAVEFESGDLEEEARTLLRDMVVQQSATEQTVHASGLDVPTMLSSLVGTVNLAAVFFGAGQLMPHAGAVADKDGSVAILCGQSGAGKSTLTAALLRRGFGYVTDETTLVDPHTLEVTPFRKPLSIKRGSQQHLSDVRPAWAGDDGVWLVPSGKFAAAALPTDPLEARMLVFPRYDPDIDGTDVQVCTPGEAAYLVGIQSSRLRDTEGGALSALARLARRVPAFHLHYADSTLAADEVVHLWPS